ncbi:unnamed protein product [Penicillium camemberti]|uniref:Str. FM013 n=1 Tax=Penicillium camemberti (strain FM 013) TaxID=1429867 RepID=A0A0G4PH39_PENC3|nr:unnamed protein product [Penicillium camemberti]
MQPVNSGQIIYSDWLVPPELAAQLYALGLVRHPDPPSADETPERDCPCWCQPSL